MDVASDARRRDSTSSRRAFACQLIIERDCAGNLLAKSTRNPFQRTSLAANILKRLVAGVGF